MNLGRHGLARHEGPGDLDAPHLERDPAVGLVRRVDVVLAPHVGVALVDPGPHLVHVDLDGAAGLRGLRRIDGERSGDAIRRRVPDERFHRSIALETSRASSSTAS